MNFRHSRTDGVVLDVLRDGVNTEGMADIVNGPHHCQAGAAGNDVTHQIAVDFEKIDWQVLEIGE